MVPFVININHKSMFWFRNRVKQEQFIKELQKEKG